MPGSVAIWENSKRAVDASMAVYSSALHFSHVAQPSHAGLNPGLTVSALQMPSFEPASPMPDHKQGKGGRFGIYVELHGFREGIPELIHPLLGTAQ